MRLSFPVKWTNSGAIEDTIIMNLDGNVMPSKLNLTRTGTHGFRTYDLSEGLYVMYGAKRTHNGNIYVTVSMVRVTKEGFVIEQSWELYRGKKPTKATLPEMIKEILKMHLSKLPLSTVIEW